VNALKSLGNLAIIIAKRNDLALCVKNGEATVYVGSDPDRAVLNACWDDDEKIGQIIHELNFGKYKTIEYFKEV
jgi:hypothetical protein